MDKTKKVRQDLFVSNGKPLIFYIGSNPEKTEIGPLIEKGGGVVSSNRLGDGIITLLLPGNRIWSDDLVYSYRYIIDCVKADQLLSLDGFKIKPGKVGNSVSEKVKVKAEANEPKEMVLRTSTRNVSRYRSEYTRAEDDKILRYIIGNELYGEVKGRQMWQQMKNQLFKERTWQSLKERYLKQILPNLSNYKLPKKEIKLLTTLGKETTAEEEYTLPEIKSEPVEVLEIIRPTITMNIPNRHDTTALLLAGLTNLSRSNDMAGTRCRDSYSMSENRSILNFIIGKNCFSDLKTNEIWQEMGRQVELRNRTSGSLKKHFETCLIPALKEGDYGLTPKQLKSFKDHLQTQDLDLSIIKHENPDSILPDDLDLEKEYTRQEDYAILGFIIEKKCFSDLDTSEIWMEMQKDSELKHRSSFSLRQRFEEDILPSLEKYNHCFARKELKAFLEYRFLKSASEVLNTMNPSPKIRSSSQELLATISSLQAGTAVGSPGVSNSGEKTTPNIIQHNYYDQLKYQAKVFKDLSNKVSSSDVTNKERSSSPANQTAILPKDTTPVHLMSLKRSLEEKMGPTTNKRRLVESGHFSNNANSGGQKKEAPQVMESLQGKMKKAICTIITAGETSANGGSTSPTSENEVTMLGRRSGRHKSSTHSNSSDATNEEIEVHRKISSHPPPDDFIVASSTNLMEQAKETVSATKQTIRKWCEGKTDKSLVTLEVGMLRKTLENLEKINTLLHKSILANRIQPIMGKTFHV